MTMPRFSKTSTTCDARWNGRHLRRSACTATTPHASAARPVTVMQRRLCTTSSDDDEQIRNRDVDDGERREHGEEAAITARSSEARGADTARGRRARAARVGASAVFRRGPAARF